MGTLLKIVEIWNTLNFALNFLRHVNCDIKLDNASKHGFNFKVINDNNVYLNTYI